MSQTKLQTAWDSAYHLDVDRSDGFTPQGQDDSFIADALVGLSQTPKRLDCKYLYDDRGSALFDRICELPEYYPTRSELAIMQAYAQDICRTVGPGALVVELGSGSSLKTRLLLKHLQQPRGYLPVDISESHVLAAAQQLQKEFPDLGIEPIVGDFNLAVEIPERFSGSRTCVYFPGSTVGNLLPHQATSLLRKIRMLCGKLGGLLIGFDLQKEVSVLEAAYNDSQGITAEFNLNMLHRLNREASASFELDHFRHVAMYNSSAARIEISIESLIDHIVYVGSVPIAFAAGERILTEYSHKYTIDGFAKLAAEAGLTPTSVWTDAREYFAVMYLEASDAD